MHQSVLGLFSSCSPVLITCGNGHKEKECLNQKNTEEISRTRSPAAACLKRHGSAGSWRAPAHHRALAPIAVPAARRLLPERFHSIRPEEGDISFMEMVPKSPCFVPIRRRPAQSDVTPDGARHADIILGLSRGQAAHGSSTGNPTLQSLPVPTVQKHNVLSPLLFVSYSRKKQTNCRSP